MTAKRRKKLRAEARGLVAACANAAKTVIREVCRVHPEHTTPMLYADLQRIAIGAETVNIKLCVQYCDLLDQFDLLEKQYARARKLLKEASRV